jgi:magnesium-transporting ATPase (P-type)
VLSRVTEKARSDVTDPSTGLTASEARARLEKGGPNSAVDVAQHPLRRAMSKLWAPVPWMLEAAILLQLVLGDYVAAGVVALLLLFNAVLGFFQEGRAQATLDALKSRLALIASVKRDGQWTTVPAAELVAGDVVKLSLGAVVAADMRLIDGSILIDQSMLTGESLPVEAVSGTEAYAGALVRRGEATAEVTATGTRTKFGRTAELVRTANGGKFPAEDGSACGPQPGAVQWRGDDRIGDVRFLARDATLRNRAACPRGRSFVDPRGAAVDVHTGCGGRGTCVVTTRRVANEPVGGG